MEWYNILSLILGALGGIGGISGFISIYTAKSNKDTIDISNLSAIIEEYRKENSSLQEEMEEYQSRVDEKIVYYGKQIELLKENNECMRAAINNAYRCQLPSKIEECPVLSHYCTNCKNNKKQ